MPAALLNAVQHVFASHETLRLDEARKARDCKLCPHCRRVVERMEGCTLMRCGSDYHGGNTQHGCGRTSFNWNNALRYEAQITALPVITATERQRAKGGNARCDWMRASGAERAS